MEFSLACPSVLIVKRVCCNLCMGGTWVWDETIAIADACCLSWVFVVIQHKSRHHKSCWSPFWSPGVCEWASCLLLVSRKFFWNSWVSRSFCQGNSGVWSLQHLLPSLDHVSLNMNNKKGHAWELSGYWNLPFMHLKHVIPARRLPHPIRLGYPRILFGTFLRTSHFLTRRNFLGLRYLWTWWRLTAYGLRFPDACICAWDTEDKILGREHLTFGWREVLVAKELTWQTTVFKTWDILVSVLNFQSFVSVSMWHYIKTW